MKIRTSSVEVPETVIEYKDLDREQAARLMREAEPVLIRMSTKEVLHFAMMKDAETIAARAVQPLENETRRIELGAVAIIMFFLGVIFSGIVGALFYLLVG